MNDETNKYGGEEWARLVDDDADPALFNAGARQISSNNVTIGGVSPFLPAIPWL